MTPMQHMQHESRRQYLIEILMRWIPVHLRPLFEELLGDNNGIS